MLPVITVVSLLGLYERVIIVVHHCYMAETSEWSELAQYNHILELWWLANWTAFGSEGTIVDVAVLLDRSSWKPISP